MPGGDPSLHVKTLTYDNFFAILTSEYLSYEGRAAMLGQLFYGTAVLPGPRLHLTEAEMPTNVSSR